MTSRLPSAVGFRRSGTEIHDYYSMGNSIKVHMCLAYQFITVITKSEQRKD